MFDICQFEERSAIAEYEGGLSRFAAETLAAKSQGKTRWEAMNAIRMGHSAKTRDRGQAGNRNAAGNLSALQPGTPEQNGQVSIGDVQAGRDRVAVPSLRNSGRGIL